MKYNTLSIQVPESKREAYNYKIVQLILSGDTQGMTPEEIYNLYTGKGKLHHLQREQFSSYYAYAEAKKEIEQGQFFTPHALCAQVCAALQVPEHFTVCDLTCGMGNFFNFLPHEKNVYGNEIDDSEYTVCRHLYPEAHFKKGDFVYYNPGETFDLGLRRFYQRCVDAENAGMVCLAIVSSGSWREVSGLHREPEAAACWRQLGHFIEPGSHI